MALAENRDPLAEPAPRGRPFLTYDDLSPPQVADLLALCRAVCDDEERFRGALAGISIGLMFAGPSTRTRTSFWRAARDLGADTLAIDQGQSQLSTGETYADTGRILGMFLDALVVRTNGPLSAMRDLAAGCPATINAMSAREHPTQALADYAAMYRHFGHVDGLRIAYFGEGNNTVEALAKLLSHVPRCQLRLYMPAAYSVDADMAAGCAARFAANGGTLSLIHQVPDELAEADIVYCTRWRTMGQDHPDPNWLEIFRPFSVTPALFARVAGDHGVFMHDLPAVREEDVSSEVLDGPRSIAWQQAYCKKLGAQTALLWALGRHAAQFPSSSKRKA